MHGQVQVTITFGSGPKGGVGLRVTSKGITDGTWGTDTTHISSGQVWLSPEQFDDLTEFAQGLDHRLERVLVQARTMLHEAFEKERSEALAAAAATDQQTERWGT